MLEVVLILEMASTYTVEHGMWNLATNCPCKLVNYLSLSHYAENYI
jgi:hypothetical protein